MEVASYCFTSGIIPKRFKKSIIVVLRKEGKKNFLLSNYKLITFKNTLVKVLEKYIINIISKAAEE